MLRPVLLLAACTTLGFTSSSQTPTVGELVARNLEAKGGVERLRGIRSVRQTSRVIVQGLEGTLTIFARRPNLTRQEMVMADQTVVQAFDGETAWTINPLAGILVPTVLSGPEAEAVKAQAAFDTPFLDYKQRGYTIELVGSEIVAGTTVHHLKMTSQAGQVQHAYLDGATGLEMRVVTQTAAGLLEQDLSDYRKVDGITKPFLIRLKQSGQLVAEVTVTGIDFNVNLKDDLFRMR